MNSVLNLDGFTFHDMSLENIACIGRSVFLKVEYYEQTEILGDFITAELPSWCIVVIAGVDQIYSMDEPVGSVGKEGDHASIFDLEWDGDDLRLTVFWWDFASRSEVFRVYRFSGSKLSVAVEACESDRDVGGG